MSPLVSLIGRPNVGKSSLYNRLTKKKAITHGTPGVTRECHRALADLGEGKEITLVDTPGFPSGPSLEKTIRLSELILFVVNGQEGFMSPEEDIIRLIRRSQRPFLLLVNKIDSWAQKDLTLTFAPLGIPEEHLYPISSAHGLGVAELLDTLRRAMPLRPKTPGPPKNPTAQVAIMGRPNSGKSTLFNRLIGDNVALVNPNPGTTRDPVESLWIGPAGTPLALVDTAGIRRRARIHSFLEGASVRRAFACGHESEVVIYLVDATTGLVRQDRRLAARILDQGASLIICFNKIDLISPQKRKVLFRDWPPGISFCPPLGVSAVQGEGLGRLGKVLSQTLLVRERTIPTRDINRHLAKTRGHSLGSRGPKIKYASMVSTSPPTFLLFATRHRDIPRNYESYLKTYFRRAFALEHTPIRFIFRENAPAPLDTLKRGRTL